MSSHSIVYFTHKYIMWNIEHRIKKDKKKQTKKADNNKCSVLNLWIKINKQNLESWSENRMSGFMKQPIRLHWNCGSSNMY